MKKLIPLLLLSFTVQSAPFVISDPVAQASTHCGYLLDSVAKVDIPVSTSTDGKYCKFDVGTLAIGTHTIKATFVNVDPIWGRSESVNSLPLNFTRPGVPASPSGLVIVP